jgi:hypothetical protein
MCPGGLHEFKIYTVDGTPKDIFSYEIFTVSDTILDKIIQGRTQNALITIDPYTIKSEGMLLKNEEIAAFMPIIEKENIVKSTELFKRLMPTFAMDKGIIFNSRLNFQASAGYKKLFLLKISTSSQAVYVLYNLFGGCKKTTKLIWDDKPALIHSSPYHGYRKEVIAN